MPATVTQPAGSPAGRARVKLEAVGAPLGGGPDAGLGGGLDVDSLEICISGMLDAVEKHLDPRLRENAWTTSVAWFRPAEARREGDLLAFDLEPAVTWHLRPHMPYVLRLRDAAGSRREERLTWIAIRLPSRAPQGYVPPPPPTGRKAAPAPADPPGAPAVAAEPPLTPRPAAPPPPEPVDPRPRPREGVAKGGTTEWMETIRAPVHAPVEERPVERSIEPGSGRSRLVAISAACLLLLIAVGLGAWFYRDALFGGTEEPGPVATPTVPTTLEGARKFLAANPGADESYGLADRFLKAKQVDGAFLLLRSAAGKGNAAAALALGEMYDPETWTPETSPLPAPNPTQAAEWYKQAADAGLAEAQYRYGMLLSSGKTAVANGPELGAAMLRKAADQGLEKAKEALPK